MPTRLLLVTLSVLIVAGAIGTVFFQRQAELHAARAATLERDLERVRAEATQEHERAQKLSTKAAELDTQLGNAKTRTTATETKNTQLARELTATKSSLTERQQREVALLSEIEALRQQMRLAETASASAPAPVAPSSATLATSASNANTLAAGSALPPNAPVPPSSATVGEPSAADLDAYRERIAALESQLTSLLTRALAEPSAPPAVAPAAQPPPAPGYRVVRVGPHDAFVIVDYGRDEGATIGDELTLHRGTTVVARVQISDARAKFSVAQVLPAALKRQLQPGDFVLIAK
ncbi:MAG: hypothetical protein KF715_02420 [Candidatus Didemnitutus sp.]|nr:hypothetical protein [Candidatus Didemnitutus sp.]